MLTDTCYRITAKTLMLPSVTNLLHSPPGHLEQPLTETTHPLLQTPSLRLEHIVSRGQASPPGFWYDQPNEEWVLLLRGSATLDFGEVGLLNLESGDSLTIPARQKHRVEEVSEDAVWIALHG